MPGPSIHLASLLENIYSLGRIGAIEGGGVCRLALTKQDKMGRDWLVKQMQNLGLEVGVDGIGNIFGTRKGKENLPPVMMGSHIDTVGTGGLYDGSYGVLAGLEVIRTVDVNGLEIRRPLTVAAFTNEEGARFAPDMMGSLVFSRQLSLAQAHTCKSLLQGEQVTVGEELARIGYAGSTPSGFPVHAYIELHIEQGPVLEEERIGIGAVELVQGISWTEFLIEGFSGHAGTTPLKLRRDAGYAAACLMYYARQLAIEMGGAQVATAGSLTLSPNLVNVIPSQARLTIDLRNTDEKLLHASEEKLYAYADEVAKKEKVHITRRHLARTAPVPFDPNMIALVERTARSLGYAVKRMPSGAGHDAQMMAQVCPTSMIFVPSVKGISHNVTEFTKPEELEAGANVLLHTVLQLASS